jgi:meso-butanediol dehydrogenase/(S,S)-butanediol dehydrogenase/diacetyl reductase
MRMEGKVAIVTGSTRGIGRAIARRLAAEGASVVVTGRTMERGKRVEAEIIDAGGRAVFVPADIDREEDVQRIVGTAIDTFGSLTTLVNNAAPTKLAAPPPVGVDGAITEISTEGWERMFRGTVTSAFLASKYAIPHLVRAGRGSIVNISSGAAVRGLVGQDAYSAAKAAMDSLTRSIARSYAHLGIRANSIVVGAVMSIPEEEITDEMRAAVKNWSIPVGKPDDIANVALFLASDEAGFVTGELVAADGGLSSWMAAPIRRALPSFNV